MFARIRFVPSKFVVPRMFLVGLLWSAIGLAVPFSIEAQDAAAQDNAAQGAVSTQPGLQPIPLPDLSQLEPAVREQLQDLQNYLESVLNDDQADKDVVLEAFSELAQTYHAYGLAQAAEAAYRNTSRLAPGDFRWPYLLAYLNQQAGQLEEAAFQYRRALELEPRYPQALLRLAEIFTAQSRTEEAEQLLDRMLQLAPESLTAKAAKAEIALAEKRYAEVIPLLQEVLLHAPEANRFQYAMGLAYRGLGDLDKAREHLAQRGEVGLRVPDALVDGLEDRKQGERAHLLRGRRAFKAGRYDEAAQAFRQAVEAQPDSVRSIVNLGSALALAGDREAAKEQFRRALVLNSANTTALYNLGSLLAQEAQYPEAAELLGEAVEIQAGDLQSRLELIRVLRRLNRLEEALEHAGQAVEMEPGSEPARFERAAILVDMGKFAAARQDLQEALQTMPRQGRLLHALARLLAGSPDLTLRDGARALELAEQVFTASATASHAATVAMALAELARCEEAAAWQKRVVEAAPTAASRELLEHYSTAKPCRYPG